jgi:type III restriction enzyme
MRPCRLVQDAYTLLGADWRAALQDWQAAGHHSPPVMLTVCNRVETAARIEHYLNHGDAHWPELKSPTQTLRVDSKVLEKAERREGQRRDYEPVEETWRRRGLIRARRFARDEKEKSCASGGHGGKRARPGKTCKTWCRWPCCRGWDAKHHPHHGAARLPASSCVSR